MATVRRISVAVATLLLAAAFTFFGWFKTFAPIATLAEHRAWTLALPEWVGRLGGASELVAAAALLVGLKYARLGRAAAVYLVVNQLAAAAVHLSRGEGDALPQNAVLIALCLLALTYRR